LIPGGQRAYGRLVPRPDLAIAAALRKDALALLQRLCDEAGIPRSNRHEGLYRHIERTLRESQEGDSLFEYRREGPSAETLKRDLLRGIPQRPIRATELRVRILDIALGAGGRYRKLCEEYWNALRPSLPGSSEVWYQICYPELDPVLGLIGRPYTAIDIAELEAHGEDLQVDYRRISPEDESSHDLYWRATGFEREGYRFLAFASLDPIHNRSFGAVALRRVGDAREEHYEGYYFRPGDPASAQPLQLERRRVAWFRSPPPGAWPRIALLDWDNTLHEGWTLIRWCEFLGQEGLIPGGAELAEKLTQLLADYPNGLSHDELAAQTAELYAHAIRERTPSEIREAARRFVVDSRRFRPYRWVDAFLRGLRDYGIAPVIISGAPAEVLAAWAVTRREVIAACFGLQAPNATSAALSNEFMSAITPGLVNPATAEGKQQLVDQLKRTRRRVMLGVGDSASDLPLWEAAEAAIYVGNVITPPSGNASSLVVENPAGWDASRLLTWVRAQFEPWRLPAPAKDV
jgi:phosphoserine phosphatase